MSQPEESINNGLTATLTSNIMVAIVIVLFLIFVLLLFLYLHAKHYHGANPITGTSRRRRPLILPPGHDTTPTPHSGLDPAVIRSLPVTVFRSKDTTGLECSVCLSELSDGEAARVLPGCRHVFHLECIDMWFHSNNTCPLCRSHVRSAQSGAADVVEIPPETDVSGGWNSVESARSTKQGSSSSSSAGCSSGKREGMLVIEIPRRLSNGFLPSPGSPLPLSRNPADELRSPMSARLRSLRRMLSRGSMGISGSPKGSGDIA